MIFNVFHDSGDTVRGTIIPDAYTKTAYVRALSGGVDFGLYPTNEFNKDVLDLGLHETGLVNFTLTEQNLPGISGILDLELVEADSGLSVYRRHQPHMLDKKYLRLETQLLPLWRLDDALKPRFQQFYTRIETLGFNATRQIFYLSQNSIYASGRIHLRNFSFSADNGFEMLVLLRDPYEELAERLLVMHQIHKSGQNPIGEREHIAMRDVIEFAGGLPFGDPRELKRAFARVPMDVAVMLANPVVRQMTAALLDEQASATSVATALDILAGSALVGVRDEPEHFIRALGELLGGDLSGEALPPNFPRVIELANLLRADSLCEAFLEKDLELYQSVLQAHQVVGSTAA